MKKLIKMMVAAFALVSGAARAGEFKAVSVGPLMNSLWDQNWPYTNFTPVNRSTNQHMPNGCVAVALSQVMHFWDWPTRIDDTWFGANFADGVPGFEQQMLAGTEIDWASMRDDCVAAGAGPMTDADYLTLGKGQILTSIVVEMKFKKQAAGADASRFAKNPWFMRTTEMNNVEGGLDAPPYEERYARVRTALTNGIPLLCTIDVGTIGHEIVVDGWRETNESDGEVHVNYGWGTLNNEWRSFKTCGVKSFMFGFVPRPMVIPAPLVTRSALPVSVRWHFPKKGYEKTLKGFAISYAEATDGTEVWRDDFETQQGTFWGELLTREIVEGCGEASTVLRIDNDSDRSTYTWPAKLLGANAELSFRYRSDRAKNQSVQVEAYDASHGWRTLESLALNESDAAAWTTSRISLADYAGRATAIRFRTERAGVGADKISGSPQFGVQIDDVQITNVRKLNPTKTLWVDSETRACALNGDVLEVGKTYVITVSPDLPNGEAGYGVATTIVESQPKKAGIVGVQSVGTTAYQFQSGIYRPCSIGTNYFAVYTTAATTKLRASLSHPALIDEILIEDEAAATPGTMILSPSSVSLANAIKIENGAAGKWLVTLCFDNLTEASKNAQEIVTIEAEDADGNIARKEIYVRLIQKGNETPVKPSDIPAYTGADESVEGALPPIVETKCTVRFDANGGSGTADVTFDNGDALVFPDVSCAGYTLDGWYTKASGGDPVEAATRVVKSATYYAQWIQSVDPIVPDDPTEPDEDQPVVTPTFPKADGAGPNDDATAKTRFCPGVKDASSGVYDVTRSNFNNYMIPAGNNLLYWWIDRYALVNEAPPNDYKEQSTPGNSDKGYTLQSYTYDLLDKALANTLPAGATRTQYFPAAMIDVATWQDGETTDKDKLIALGRHIYEALAHGPIGIQIDTYKTYGAVIWGCEYVESGEGNYATALYITDTVLNTRTDTAQRKVFAMTSNNYGSGAGLLNFNGTTPGIISSFYPISAPEPESSGAGEVTVMVAAGGKEVDISKAFSKVEKGAGNVVSYTLDAAPGKKIEIGGEQISILPELADGDDETPFAVRDGTLVFKVKSIPGLKYQVLASESLAPDSFAPAGQEREATGTRRELTVTRSGETKGFYKIQVSR